MAITKSNGQDCKQYYHLGLDFDDDDDFEPEMPEAVDRAEGKDQAKGKGLSLADELSQAASADQKTHPCIETTKPTVIVNQLCLEEQSHPSQLVIRTEPKANAGNETNPPPPPNWTNPNGESQTRNGRRMLIHKVATSGLSNGDMLACGSNCCTIA